MAQMPEAIILRKTEETKTGVTYCVADVKTNADRIRSMTDEELAEKIVRLVVNAFDQVVPEWKRKSDRDNRIAGTANDVLNWLKQEATE